MTDTTTKEPTTEQLENHAKLLEIKHTAFSVVLEHAKDLVIDKMTLEAAAFRVEAHKFFTHIQTIIKQELEQVKGLIEKKQEVVAPVTTPEPTKDIGATGVAYALYNNAQMQYQQTSASLAAIGVVNQQSQV